MTYYIKKIPIEFLWRRIHSLAGLGLVMFIMSHLITNAQAALPIGQDGIGFIKAVNLIHSIPFLLAVEIFVLALPIILHAAWGIKYMRTSQQNSLRGDGSVPSLPHYPRNHAYTWQRITSWILLVGIAAHVIHMRFIEYPEAVFQGDKKEFVVKVSDDPGLHTLATRIGVKITHENEDSEVTATAPDFGTADLLVVRDAFKHPSMIVLYSLLVVSGCFHAFNGLSTFLITWGVTLTERSQIIVSYLSIALMTLFSVLGLSAVWLTYWVNLKS